MIDKYNRKYLVVIFPLDKSSMRIMCLKKSPMKYLKN